MLIILGAWRKKWLPVMAAVAVLVLAATPLTSGLLVAAVEGGRVRPEMADVPQADAIVVLSGGYRPAPGISGASEFDDFDRFLGGFDLWKAGKAPSLVFTGGWSPSDSDRRTVGDVLRERAVAAGVPPEAIAVAGRATNTSEEAAGVASFLAAHPAPPARVILVTSASHMTRAAALFREAGLRVVEFPVDFRRPLRVTARSFVPSGSGLHETDLALHEIYGCTFDWMRRLGR